MFQDVRDRRLAAGAGHADHRHIPIRKLVVTLGDQREGLARITDADERHFRRRKRGYFLRDNRHGAAADGFINAGNAIGPPAGERKEHVARHHPTAVDGETRDRTLQLTLDGDDFIFAKIVGKFRRQLEDAIEGERFTTGPAHRAGLERMNERIIMSEIADHGRAPLRATRLPVGAGNVRLPALRSSSGMSCSPMRRKDGAATLPP